VLLPDQRREVRAAGAQRRKSAGGGHHARSALQLDVVGDVPSGLLPPLLPPTQLLPPALPSALMLGLISFTTNWAVAVQFAEAKGYEVDANAELVAAGLSNLVGALFNGFIVTGGLARSAVNAESGAETPLAGAISAVMVIVALECLTSWVYFLPRAALAAIIMTSVFSMVNISAMTKTYGDQLHSDCALMVLTSLVTFFVGPIQGVVLGVLATGAMQEGLQSLRKRYRQSSSNREMSPSAGTSDTHIENSL
jgi:sulfate permease, SulP family